MIDRMLEFSVTLAVLMGAVMAYKLVVNWATRDKNPPRIPESEKQRDEK